jgi:toxin-antitoxin system PIN domain toxin
MILVDANLLIYAVKSDSPHHDKAKSWLEEILSGSDELGLAWIVVLAFIRITTRPGILSRPLTPERAIAYIDEWLEQPYVNLVNGDENQWPIFRNLQLQVGTAGNLTSDTMLASLALELGAVIYSADHDFKRFSGVKHVNPLEPS